MQIFWKRNKFEIDKQMDGRTDGRTDERDQTYYLPGFAVDNNTLNMLKAFEVIKPCQVLYDHYL